MLAKLSPFALEAFFLLAERLAALFVLGDLELFGIVPASDNGRPGFERRQFGLQLSQMLSRRLDLSVERGEDQGRSLGFLERLFEFGVLRVRRLVECLAL